MKFVYLFLLIALGQMIHSAPVTDKSDEDRELDSWLADIEQALDKEIPEKASIQEVTDKEGPAFDRNGKMANRAGPVDMEEWEEEVTNEYGHNEEIENKISDDDLGFEPSDITDQSVDPEGDKLPQANSKVEDDEQQFADNMAMRDDFDPEESDNEATESQEYWEDDKEYKETDKQQVDNVNSNEMQELENYVNEPSRTSEDSWEDNWEDDWQDKPTDQQQGYYMEMAGQSSDKAKMDDSNEPWEEPNPKDFDDIQFDDEFEGSKQAVDYSWEEKDLKEFDGENNDKEQPNVTAQQVDNSWEEPGPEEFDDLQFDTEYKNNDKENTDPDANEQPVDDDWEEPGPKKFDDSQFDDELKEFNVNSQSDDAITELGNKEQESWEPDYKNFDDLDVVEDVIVNLDDIPVESVEPEQWAASNSIPDDFQPKIMGDNQSDSVKGMCIKSLYVMAFTSDLEHSGSDSPQGIEIRAGGDTYKTQLPNLPGDDYQPNKGDLWKLSFEKNFYIDKCVTSDMIGYIAITGSSKDGWNIDSIVTFFVYDEQYSKLATVNLDVLHWVDEDGADSHKQFELNRVY